MSAGFIALTSAHSCMSHTSRTLQNPKDIIGSKKPSLHLVPPALEIYVAEVFKHGARKYGEFNWREKAVSRVEYISAARRHLLALLDGEDNDPDSGLPHEAHVAGCMGVLLDAMACGKLIDDRPTKGAAAKLLKQFTRE